MTKTLQFAVIVEVVDGENIVIRTDDWLTSLCVQLWNAECQIANDDENGLISRLNAIWDIRHPNTAPNSSEDLFKEYIDLHEIMEQSAFEVLSWTIGVDTEHKVRVRLLDEPLINENDGICKIKVAIFDL